MIKQFSAGDKIVRPFKTFKNWKVQSVDSSSVDSFGRSTWFTNYGEVNAGRNITIPFYPSGNINYNPVTEPMANGKYSRNIYSLTDAMFYKNSGNSLELFGVESSDMLSGNNEVREIHDKVVTLRLAHNFWGEKIVPKTVNIVDNSNVHNTMNIFDDGITNLFVTGSHFSTDFRLGAVKHLPPVSMWNSASAQFFVVLSGATQSISYEQARTYRDQGLDVSYTIIDSELDWQWNYSASRDYFEPENERFGQSVSAWYKYIAVGSPMDTQSLSSELNGYAALFKYDEEQQRHRLIKRFYSPQTQDALADEFGNDNSILMELEDNEFNSLESSGTSGSFEDGFGYSVSVGDNFLAVGAPTGSPRFDYTSNSGFVYIYDKNKGGADNWGIINILQGDTPNDRFGNAVSIDGDLLAIGAPGVSGSSGEVYIFRRKRYMDSQNPCSSVMTSSFWQQIGDYGLPLLDESGSVIYANVDAPAFVSGNYTWEYEARLTSSLTQPLDFFGWTLEANNNKVLVGNRKTTGTGYVSLFVCNFISSSLGDCPTASWVENSYYRADNSLGDLDTTSPDYAVPTPLSFDGFGWSVALNGNNMAVGSYFDKGFLPYNGAPSSSLKILGAVYFYHYFTDSCDVVNFNPIQKTFGDQTHTTCNLFGRKISIDGLKAAVTSENPTVFRAVDFSGSILLESASYSGSFLLESSSYQTNGAEDGVLGRISMYSLKSDYTWERVGEVRRNKEKDQPFNSFGKDISLSSDFLAVGAPIYNSIGTSSIISNFTGSNYDAITDYNLQVLCSFSSEYSGSVFVYDLEDFQNNPKIGNVFYKNGYLVITNTGSYYQSIFTGTGSLGFDLSYQGTHTIFEHEYLVSVRPGEFNYSTNPSSLIQNPTLFDINGDGIFDLSDLDLIMRYLNKKRFYEDFVFDDNGFVLETDTLKDDSWWNSDIIMTESEDVLLQESEYSAYLVSSSFTAFTKKAFDYIETNLVNTGILDIDGDGKIDLNDGALLVAYFTNTLTAKSLPQWINNNSTRRYVVDIKSYIGKYTGIQQFYTDPNFFNYQASSSYDPTGSYLAPYISTIGLYDNTGALVAISKLGKPIKNLIDWPINFVVRFDT